MIEIPVRYSGAVELLQYATVLSGGMDFPAFPNPLETLNSVEREFIPTPTGLSIALPESYEAQVRPRSGVDAKDDTIVLNPPGTIDTDYLGDIGVILFNLSQEPFTISLYDRIAQLVLAQYATVEWQALDTLPESGRGIEEFDSTGEK